MPIDLSVLSKGTAAGPVLEPRAIFSALPGKDAQFQYPRDVQAEVWSRWFERRSDHDIVVKMNTGAGKTTVGLVMLQSCINEGVAPVVYVAPDKYLVEQVIGEARLLGIAATRDESDAEFLGGRAILVANPWKLFNGKSRFGLAHTGVKIALEAVVIDDVHACVDTLAEQFTVVIDAKQDAKTYSEIVGLFEKALDHQSPHRLRSILDGDPTQVMQIPYWAWQDRHVEVGAVLSRSAAADLQMHLPLIEEVLEYCVCVLHASRIEIAPRVTPIEVVPSFVDAKRRIFMTATLADDGVLVTNLGVSPEAARTPITPKSAADIGDRLILVPAQFDAGVSDDVLRALCKDVSTEHNVIVIVPSEKASQQWTAYADRTVYAPELAATRADLVSGHVGLVVLVNKYDGIDLPDEACRLLVLDGLPVVRSLLERVDDISLRGTAMHVRRSLRRIEQGMGRGVRSPEDRCAVVLMGRSLTQQFFLNRAEDELTASTRAQFTLSRTLTAQLKGQGVKGIREALELVFGRNQEWIKASREALLGLGYADCGKVSSVSEALRASFSALVAGDPATAEVVLADVVAEPEHAVAVRGWLKQELATVVRRMDPVRSQQLQGAARRDNSQLLKPMVPPTYTKLGAMAKQATAIGAFLKREKLEGAAIALEYARITVDLEYGTVESNVFERALDRLGEALGFHSQRPDHDFANGPDVLWSVGALEYWVIECKNEVASGFISRSATEQLGHSMDWFEQVYSRDCNAEPILLIPSKQLHRQAVAVPGMRVVDASRLTDWMKVCRQLGTALSQLPSPVDQSKVEGILAALYLNPASILSKYSVRPRIHA